MVSSFFYDENDNSPASTRRSRVEWKLRKQFDYAGHRREMVQSFREAEKYFKENLQFPKMRRRESVADSNRVPTAEQQREDDCNDADVHHNMGALVTPAGGGFGPGYGAQTQKKTLEEKRAARDRLVRRIHEIEGYAATPGVIATVDPESGDLRTVGQTKKEIEQLKKKGNRAPFVDKARLFPPLRTKTIPSTALSQNNQNVADENAYDVVATTSSARSISIPANHNHSNNSSTSQQKEYQYTKTLKNQNDDDDEDLNTHLQIPHSHQHQHPSYLPDSSRLSAFSSLSQKIANQTTPTPLPPIQQQQFVSLTPRGTVSALQHQLRQKSQQQQQHHHHQHEGGPSFLNVTPTPPTTANPNNNSNLKCNNQNITTTTGSNSVGGATSGSVVLPPSSNLDELFTSARSALKNAPVATAATLQHQLPNPNARFFLGTAGSGAGGGAHTRGSSRQTSRLNSRKPSFVSNGGGINSNNNNNTNNNNNNTANWNEILSSGGIGTELGSVTLTSSSYGGFFSGPGSPRGGVAAPTTASSQHQHQPSTNNNTITNSAREQHLYNNNNHHDTIAQLRLASNGLFSSHQGSMINNNNKANNNTTNSLGVTAVGGGDGMTPRSTTTTIGNFPNTNASGSSSSQQQQNTSSQKQILKITISSNNVSV